MPAKAKSRLSCPEGRKKGKTRPERAGTARDGDIGTHASVNVKAGFFLTREFKHKRHFARLKVNRPSQWQKLAQPFRGAHRVLEKHGARDSSSRKDKAKC